MTASSDDDELSIHYKYDVCLSFAGEQRQYVSETAEHLRNMGVRVFYDKYEVATLWGKNLYDHLQAVYREGAKYCVMCISADYARKVWTNHERTSAQARALSEKVEYILPARFDDTEIPGILPTVGYIDLREVSPAELAELIVEKLGRSMPAEITRQTIFGVPRTAAQREHLLRAKPDGWEYLLFAGLLLQGKESLENKYLNHQIGLASESPRYLDDAAAWDRFSGAMDELSAIIGRIGAVFDARAQRWAFGEPGLPGDAARIEHLSSQIVKVYEELLDWADTMRGFAVSARFRRLSDLSGHMADRPMEQIRDLISELVKFNENLSDRIAASQGEPISANFVLKVSIDDELKDSIIQEMERAFVAWKQRHK